MPLNIVTTNKYKLANARKQLARCGIKVKSVKMNTPEIQAMTGKDITAFSARYAADKLNVPVALTDAGVYIRALGGFPGPFIKYTNHWLSVFDFDRLMRGKRDRRVELTEWLAYCEPGKKPVTFKSTVRGRMSVEPHGESPNPIDYFFVPDGHDRPMATWTEREKRKLFAKKLTHWTELAEYMKPRLG